MGDVVLAGAAIAAFAEQHPDTQIRLYTKSIYTPLFAFSDWLTVIGLDTTRGPADLWRIAQNIRAWKPDLIADFHSTLRANVLRTLLPQFRWRRARKYSLARWLKTKGQRQPLQIPHVVERNGAVLGVTPTPGDWITGLREEESKTGTEETLALVPGAAWATKRWPIHYFIDIASRWHGQVLWFGGDAERLAIESAIAKSTGSAKIALPLDDTVKEIASADVVVANDTGLAHIAAAVGTPVITIYGPTDPAFGFHPWGKHVVISSDLECRPCSLHGHDACPLEHHACLTGIGTDRVWSELMALTKNK